MKYVPFKKIFFRNTFFSIFNKFITVEDLEDLKNDHFLVYLKNRPCHLNFRRTFFKKISFCNYLENREKTQLTFLKKKPTKGKNFNFLTFDEIFIIGKLR